MKTRLKQLELHGYKTFAGRFEFEFPGQITAVVGPNGSGKSNIADSIRWVLGEQSYGLLRGRKTEDMIFAGSEHRPRAGMASATITFNNEDGWLPIDFSEVSVTRRAYRDGQNEYLLNGQKVRLKEISELLAQSGLAERTYTMIGQGLVDAALSLKPDERRRFFEEAAGIGLYRSRREESLNRLDTTRRNLERVLDILSELEPRLKSLEKQAQKAIEYERIKADLRILLRDWYGYHWNKSQQDLTHSRDVLQAQEGILLQARQRMESADAELGEARGRLQEVRTRLNAWHSQSAELHTQREKISRNLAVLDERQRAMTDQEKNLLSDRTRLEEEEKAQLQRIQALEEERQRLRNEVQEAQTQVNGARKKLEERQMERELIDRSIRDVRRQLVAAETGQVQAKAHANELGNRVENLRRTQKSLQDALNGAEESLEAARQKLETARKQKAAVEVERQDLEKEQISLQQETSELENRRKKHQEEQVRLNGERSRLRAQLDVLLQAEKSLTGLNQGAKSVLQEAGQGRLPGKYRALSGLLEVPAEVETALAAVLGEFIDAVLLDSKTDPEPALKLLAGGQKGRAMLFLQDWVRPVERLTAPADPECIGVAVDMVRAPEELRPMVEAVLGQVLIVRNRTAARRLLESLPSSARAVTLQGEVFYASGAVSAGTEGRASVLARPRQKRELEESLAAVEEAFQTAQTQVLSLEKKLAAQRAIQQDLDKDLRAINQRVSQAAQAFQQVTLEMEQVRQRQEFQRRQLNGTEDQVIQAEKERQKTSAEIEAAGEKIEALNTKIRDLNRSLGGLPLEELQAQVVHWNTNVAVAGRAEKDAERRWQEYQQTLTGNQSQRSSIQQRIQNIQNQLASLDAERTGLRGQESQVNQEIETLRQDIEPAEAYLAQTEQEVDRLQKNQSAAQQTVSVAERHSTQAQLEFTRHKDALELLRKRIEEDFGLVAFEYNQTMSGPTPLPLNGLVEQLPVVAELSQEIEESINRQRAQMRRLGAVNLEAQAEYISVRDRYNFLNQQVADLRKADTDLREVIAELDALMKKEFRRTFDAVAAEFKIMFTRLFGGGTAHLLLTDEDNPTQTGIDILAKLPGRREQGLSLLSGGERSLTAVALIFSLLKISPTPFCVMDEVDAALDEANVGRFCDLLRELSQHTQFIVITHNRNTVQIADVIYGVTMGKDSASQVISLRLDEVSDDMIRRDA